MILITKLVQTKKDS